MDIEEAIATEVAILKEQGQFAGSFVVAALKAAYEHGYNAAIDFVATGE